MLCAFPHKLYQLSGWLCLSYKRSYFPKRHSRSPRLGVTVHTRTSRSLRRHRAAAMTMPGSRKRRVRAARRSFSRPASCDMPITAAHRQGARGVTATMNSARPSPRSHSIPPRRRERGKPALPALPRGEGRRVEGQPPEKRLPTGRLSHCRPSSGEITAALRHPIGARKWARAVSTPKRYLRLRFLRP